VELAVQKPVESKPVVADVKAVKTIAPKAPIAAAPVATTAPTQAPVPTPIPA
jgi:hypothetical protein